MSLSPEQLPARILIVDDEEFVREAIELYFSTEGFQTFTASSGAEALERIREESIDLAILDIMMPGMDGIQLLREIKKFDADIEVVMASGCGTIESAIESMRLGAYDYVTKPILNFDEDLLKVVRKALERRKLLTSNRKLSADLQQINRELKKTNGRLKRHVAELEVLYENGRVLGELATLDLLANFVMQTLEHHLDMSHALLVTPCAETDSWSVQGHLGFPDLRPPDVLRDFYSLLEASTDAPGDVVTVPASEHLAAEGLFALCGLTPVDSSGLVLAPLRAQGNTHGFLAVLSESPPDADWTRLLRLVAAQIAAPIRMLRKEMTA